MNHPTAHATAVRDQVAAATRDARQSLEHAATTGHGELVDVAAGSWLADQASALQQRILAGNVRRCRHVGPSPSILHAALWAPGVLVCPPCAYLLRPDPDEDETCDRCRVASRPIIPGLAAYGFIVIGYGLCPPCAANAAKAG